MSSVSGYCISRIFLPQRKKKKKGKSLHLLPKYLIPPAWLIEYGNLTGKIDRGELFSQLSEFDAMVYNLLSKGKNPQQ